MERQISKFKISNFKLIFVTVVVGLLSASHCVSGNKLDTLAEDKKVDILRKEVFGEKKVSFSGEKVVPKLFGAIPLPWPFNITNNPQANINPGGAITGTSADTSADNFGGSFGTLGTSAVLIKGGLLTMITALKAVLIPPLLLIVLVAFLVAGAAFFTCSLVDCSAAFGGLGLNGAGNSGGATGTGSGSSGLANTLSAFSNPFNRNTYDYYDQARPVYQALDDGYQKYGSFSQDQSGTSNSKTK